MQNKVNAYTCEKCGKQTVTIDRHEGVTPFMLGCRATPRCTGMGTSGFYRCAQSLVPVYEWFKPTIEELQRDWTLPSVQHALQGGLLLRRCDGKPDKRDGKRRRPRKANAPLWSGAFNL